MLVHQMIIYLNMGYVELLSEFRLDLAVVWKALYAFAASHCIVLL